MVLVFQYGSNMERARLEGRIRERLERAGKRIEYLEDKGMAVYEGHTIAFDLYAALKAKCSTADIADSDRDVLLGRLWDMDQNCFDALKKIEGRNYEPTNINVKTRDGKIVKVTTFIGTPEARETFMEKYSDKRTSPEYLGFITRGLREIGAPDSYVSRVERIAGAFEKLSGSSRHHIMDVSTVYEAPRDRLNSISMNEKMRKLLDVNVGDMVEIEHEGNKIALPVSKAPHTLVGDNAVCLAEKYRNQLGIQKMGERVGAIGFKSKYEGVRIKKRE
jgi:hypothetical protein